MSTAQRRIDAGVIARLFDTPYRFEFFQAVRMLELWYARAGVAGNTVSERLRFANSLSLAFPPSEIESIAPISGEREGEREREGRLDASRTDQVRITPAFLGMLGAQGALPLHYSESFALREMEARDRAPRAFLDIFSNRSVALFYAAWKKYRPHLQYELDRSERFLPMHLALSGFGFAELRDRMQEGAGKVFDQSIAHYVAAARHRPMSAAYAERIVSDHFRVPVRIEQFVGRWCAVPEREWSRLGGTRADARPVLGSSALIGARVWQRDLRVRLHIGPLTRERFESFLPGADGAAALAKMLTLLLGLCLEFEVRLLLRAEDVRGVTLPEKTEPGVRTGRLGWDAFLVSKRAAQHARSDAGYVINALA